MNDVAKTYYIRKLFLLCISLLIASDIVNKTPYRADLDYVYIPLVSTTFVAILVPKYFKYKGYFFTFLLAMFTFISTVLSDVIHLRDGDIKYYIFIFSFVIISSVKLEKNEIRIIINTYSVIALLLSCWLIIGYALGTTVRLENRATLVVLGVAKDQNYTGAFFAPAVLFYFYKFLYSNKKIKNMSFLIVILVAIFFTGSRAALLTCILCIPFAFIFTSKTIDNKRKILYLVIITVVGLIVYYYLGSSKLSYRMTDVEGYTDNIRLVIWGYAMRGFYENPIIGEGLYSASYYSQLYVRWVTHNSFIDILVGQGIIGVILLLLIYRQFIITTKSENRAFIFVLLLSFFIPYFFLNGYETLSFWLPMILIKMISDSCKETNYSYYFSNDTEKIKKQNCKKACTFRKAV